MSAKIDVSVDGMKPVPDSIDEITPAWCEWALRQGGSIGKTTTITSAEVERFKDEDTGEINDGGGLTGAKLFIVTIKYGGEITGNEPSSIVGKIMFECKESASLPWRIILKLAGSWDLTSEDFWRTDIKFFRNILPIIKDKYKTPKVYYTGIVDKGNRNYFTSTILNKPCRVKTVSLMEDFKGWGTLTLDKLISGESMDFENCVACLKNLAVLHATFWGGNHSEIKNMFQRLSFMESTFKEQAHSKMVSRKRTKFACSTETIQKGLKVMIERWKDESYMSINESNKLMIPDWFSAETLEDGSYPILKDSSVLEMLNVCSERFPNFAKQVINPYLKIPMQTICHGDFQSGNHMYGKGENKGKIVAVDFQCVGMGMASGEVLAFICWTMPSRNFMHLAKCYHTALEENGIDNYPWEAFKKDLIIEIMENIMKTSMDFAERTMKKFDQMFGIFGDKFAGFKKFLEGGVCGMMFLLATDMYRRDKENFLNPETFDKNM